MNERPPVTPGRLDEIYAEYSEEVGFERVLMKYKALEILSEIRGNSVLDVGCGIGILARLMASDRTVVGIDGSADKIRRARELDAGEGVEYVHVLFEDWSPDRTFDTIVLTNVLEHLPDPAGFLRRCLPMLSRGGRLLLTVPNALGLHKRIGFRMGLATDYHALTEADVAKGHFWNFDRARLETLVASNGFKVEQCRGILLKPLSHCQMESWDPKVVDALYEIGKELPDYCSSLILVASPKAEP
jgi:2-polyprenyl-3-methyl-5-hydroxy-6-metoxy-1,4-benzoquinol methylase